MNTEKLKIGIIGAGVMGNIFAKRLVESGFTNKANVLVNDKDKSKLNGIKDCATAMSSQKELAKQSDALILAVKPQDFKVLSNQLKGLISKETLIISIMAGLDIGTIAKLLEVDLVARAMPNITAKIGKGVVVWKASDSLNQKQKQEAESILGCLGKTIEVQSEQYIDMATAVSGSGPAYVFLFQEIFTKAAENLGLPKNIAKELVIETILGSLALQKDSGESPAVLREKVTSKGGTTAAAIKVFEENSLAEIFKLALRKAYERNQELKRQND